MTTIGLHIHKGDSREALLGHFTDIGVHDIPRAFGLEFSTPLGMWRFTKLNVEVHELFTPFGTEAAGQKFRLSGKLAHTLLGATGSFFDNQPFTAYFDTRARKGYVSFELGQPTCPKHPKPRRMRKVTGATTELTYRCKEDGETATFPLWACGPIVYTECFWCDRPIIESSNPPTCAHGHLMPMPGNTMFVTRREDARLS